MKTKEALKTIACLSILAALGAGSRFASASKCTHAQNVTRAEIDQINGRVARINLLASEAHEDQRRVNAEVKPRLEAWNHIMKIHEQRLNSLREAVVAVQQVGSYLEGTVSSDLSLKLVLDQLRNSQRLSPDRRLAEQLNAIARTSNMRASARESLLQFAKTVNLLEKTHAEFAAAEVRLIEDYLNGRNTLVSGMLDTLNHIAERLSYDLNQAEAASNQDRLTTADLAKQVADEKVRQAARSNEIQSLADANAASAANMNQWKPEDHCTTDMPRESVEDFMRRT